MLNVGDRVTFNSDEGIQAGCVADIMRDIRNGQPYAWIELTHQWSGMFQSVPIEKIITIGGGDHGSE